MNDATPHLPWPDFVRIKRTVENDRRMTTWDTADAAYRLGYEAGVQAERVRHDREQWQEFPESTGCNCCGQTFAREQAQP